MDALPEGGELRFTTRQVRLDAAQCEASVFDLEPGLYLQVEVVDTGTGIPAEYLEHLFEPFFTTKARGEGTGLGLAAVWGIVRQHRAAIRVYSEVGRGTAFTLDLPLADEGDLARPTLDEEPIPGTGLVLVVDDEAMVRSIARAILEQLGCDVVTADDGEQALEIYARKRPELVLLDMVMPHLNGRQVFERLRAADPEVRVILSSGFSQDEDLLAMREQGLLGFVSKPYDVARLSRAVAAALESTPATGP